MNRFILKSSLILALALLPNLLMGLLRIYCGDKNIPFEVHRMTAQKDERVNVPYQPFYISRTTYLSRDSIRNIKYIRDQNYSSDVTPNKHPDFVFVGDSYFADIFMSADSGVQAVCNNILGYNASYNLGHPNGSRFRRYRSLTESGFIAPPKIIICEIAERNLPRWTSLRNDLLATPAQLADKNYYGLDLLFGNNFSNLRSSKLFGHKASLGHRVVINGIPPQYFLDATPAIFPSRTLKDVARELLFVQDYFAKKHIIIWFVVVPDKESMYPTVFGPSRLPSVCAGFRTSGIRILELTSELAMDPRYYFLDNDNHWNSHGVARLMEVLKKEGALDTARAGSILSGIRSRAQ